MVDIEDIGTRRYIMSILPIIELELPDFKSIQEEEHELPQEIADKVPQNWESFLDEKESEMNANGVETKKEIDEKTNLSVLYAIEDGELIKRVFSGSISRFNGFIQESLTFRFGKTTYADLISTNNKEPYSILEKYGKRGLANPINATTSIIADRSGDSVIFLFHRAIGLGEYGSTAERKLLACTSGGITPDDPNPYEAALREINEETGLKKYFSEQNQPIFTGVTINIDPDDVNHKGENVPHFRPELLAHINLGAPIGVVEDHYLGSGEYEDMTVVDFKADALGSILLDKYADILPPTIPALELAGKIEFGTDWFKEVHGAINKKYPIEENHPFYSRLRSGEIGHEFEYVVGR